MAHAFANHADAAARTLIVCTPAGFERHFARIAAEQAGVAVPDWAMGPLRRSRPSGRRSSARRVMSARRLSPRARKAVLTLHVGVSVALIGVTGSVLIVALRAAGADSAAEAHALYTSAQTLAFALAIPFSLTSLATGIVLGLGTRWGVRHLPLGGGQARAAACDHPHGCARRQAVGAGADRQDRGRPAARARRAGSCRSRVPPT